MVETKRKSEPEPERKKRKPRSKVPWNDSFYVKAADLARSGLRKNKIAEALGVGRHRFLDWYRAKPALREAIEIGRSGSPGMARGGGEGFLPFLYGRLPPDLQDLWDGVVQINEREEAVRKRLVKKPKLRGSKPSAYQRRATAEIEAMFTRHGSKRARMSLWFHALVKANFSVHEACRMVNVSKTNLDVWARDEPYFEKLIAELKEAKKDFAEALLWRGAAAGSESLIVFLNRALNADRGFNPGKKVEVGGTVSQIHVDLLKVIEALPPESKQTMLAAIRAQRGEIPQLPVAEATP